MYLLLVYVRVCVCMCTCDAGYMHLSNARCLVQGVMRWGKLALVYLLVLSTGPGTPGVPEKHLLVSSWSLSLTPVL